MRLNQNLLECQECGNEIFTCKCKCSSHFYRDKDRLDELLTYCISKARKMLIICSPWITQHASRPIIQQLRAAKNRNAELQIFVYTDDNDEKNVRPLGERNDDIFDIYKRGFVESIREMEDIGIQVYRMSRVHNKSICVDDRIFIEGSLNWLSATRDRQYRNYRHDTGVAIFGKHAKNHIDEFLDAQAGIEYGYEIISNQDEADAMVRDLIRYPPDPEPQEQPPQVPRYEGQVEVDRGQRLYFAVVGHRANSVVRRGIDARELKRNGGEIYLARLAEHAVEGALLFHKEEYDEEAFDQDVVVFEVDLLRMEEAIHFYGRFGRGNRLRDESTPIVTDRPIPPEAIRLMEGHYQRSSGIPPITASVDTTEAFAEEVAFLTEMFGDPAQG